MEFVTAAQLLSILTFLHARCHTEPNSTSSIAQMTCRLAMTFVACADVSTFVPEIRYSIRPSIANAAVTAAVAARYRPPNDRRMLSMDSPAMMIAQKHSQLMYSMVLVVTAEPKAENPSSARTNKEMTAVTCNNVSRVQM